MGNLFNGSLTAGLLAGWWRRKDIRYGWGERIDKGTCWRGEEGRGFKYFFSFQELWETSLS